MKEKINNIANKKWALGAMLVLILACFMKTLKTNGADVSLLIAAFVCGFVSCAILLFESMKNGSNALDVLGVGGANDKRKLSFDLLRIIAVLAVLGTHVIQIDLSRSLVSDKWYGTFLAIAVLMLVCNPLFVMISTSLLFSYKDENPLLFYYKRVTKVMLPMIVYYIWYVWQNLQFEGAGREIIGDIAIRLFIGQTNESPHYWLMYVILTIYLFVPFIRWTFKEMPYEIKTLLCILCYAQLFIATFLNSIAPPAISLPIAGWLSVGIIGYWCMLSESRKYDILVVILGIIGAIYCWNVTISGGDYSSLCCNTSPVLVSCAATLEVIIIRLCGDRHNKSWILQLLSKYSFGIMLIHWWTINWVNVRRYQMGINQYKYIGGFTMEVLSALFFSIIVAICLDNMVLTLIQKLFDLIKDGLACAVKKLVIKLS